MKKRRIVLEVLTELCEGETSLDELKAELKDFFYKLDLYYCYKQNTILFTLITSSVYYTTIQICEMAPMNKKGLLRFIDRFNSFTILLLEQPKYKIVRELYYHHKE